MRFEYGVGRGNGGQNDNPCEDSNDKKPVICELVIVFFLFLSLSFFLPLPSSPQLVFSPLLLRLRYPPPIMYPLYAY